MQRSTESYVCSQAWFTPIRFTPHKKWPRRQVTPIAPVCQRVIHILVYGLLCLTMASLPSLVGCRECWEVVGPPEPPPLPQVPVRDPLAPVQGACTQRGEAGVSPVGLRRRQARRRMRTCFRLDPAVSPKRQLNPSCSTAHVHNLDLLKTDNRVGGCVPSTATHLTFHGGRHTCQNEVTFRSHASQAWVTPPNGKDKATADHSCARPPGLHLSLSYQVCCHCSGPQR